ncbi:amidohydrolase family protein [Marinococcus halophilus]|uniref:Hydrolase n=1 Tax=Marinococcus halophilus TaxID=1371 RepID=A0A510Y513_MARHA|nr:amidohydrolase family protein [Marinococcus halophilus]OZT80349.1 amidohydrolase family protein [Marinococcus halophilus]GEK58410.1 hydrolase [Marinococcus halophilus]
MENTLIKNGTLIDGKGNDPITNASVLIQDDKIQAIGPEAELKAADNTSVIDAEGKYVLPGFIDTHVHMMLEMKSMQKTLTTPFSYRFYESVHYLERTIQTGITSVRDAGFADAGLKQAVNDELVKGPRMQISINPLTITGGHGDHWMRSGVDAYLTGVDHPGMPNGVCDGTEEVRKTVRKMLRAGADVIKVHATGGVTSPTDHPEFTQFTQEELEVMVEEASFRKGKKVMAHAQGSEGIKNAIRAGIHSIEHGIFLDDEAIELMIKNGTYLVPTLLAPVAVLEDGENEGNMSEYAMEKSREVIEHHRESIKRAYEAGVTIAMGTDAGVMKHGTNLRELGLMCDIGMSPMDALIATTKTAAECLGWGEYTGTVEEGKWADLVIVDKNPLEDIRLLENEKNILFVMKEGKVYKSTL